MYHLKLVKALSFTGIVTATKKNPDVFVEDRATADAAVATGYFKLVEDGPANLDAGQFGDWSLEEVKRLAEAMEIDTTGLSSKAEYVAAIEAVEVIPGPGKDVAEEQKPGKKLEEMTVPELETFAAYSGISLKGISKKADILAKLKEELVEAVTENEVDYGSPTMTELQGQ